MLLRCLRGVAEQESNGGFTWSIVVADNDASESSRSVVEGFAKTTAVPVVYCVEPCKNIALARNKACALAEGDFLAFIDDDEFPEREWLLRLLTTCQNEGVAGVLGPVLPYYDAEPPRWIVKGRFYERPRHATGFQLNWPETRTGNVLLRKCVVEEMGVPFQEEFSNGGEDQDFFRRAMQKGHVFVWCDEGTVSEVVAPSRWSRRVMIRRALLRGRNSSKHSAGRTLNLLKSMVATPIYLLALPVCLVLGQHLFMNLVIKLCDHVGRLLAVVNLNPVREREM
jgi:succinoglycan biosynthesis protein ExoM